MASTSLIKTNDMDSMQLVTPGIGLMFWTVVIFILLLVILKKFAWKPILDAVDDRNKSIEEALNSLNPEKGDLIMITGSLYLAGELLNLN